MLTEPDPAHSYEELDILFANGVSARKFASTDVDAYADAPAESEKH